MHEIRGNRDYYLNLRGIDGLLTKYGFNINQIPENLLTKNCWRGRTCKNILCKKWHGSTEEEIGGLFLMIKVMVCTIAYFFLFFYFFLLFVNVNVGLEVTDL